MSTLRWLAAAALVLAVAAPASADRVALRLEAGAEAVAPGGEVELEVVADIARGWHINARQPRQDFLIPTELTFTAPPGVELAEVFFPPPLERRFAFAPGETLLVYEGKLGLATAFRVDPAYPGGRVRLEATLRYQACNDTTCARPATARAVLTLPVDTAAPAATSGAFDPGEDAGESRIAGWLAEHGLVFTLLAVAVLGLGLNLTPCVYPLVSVTVAYFGGQERRRAHVAGLAAVYVLGIALTFSTLGVAAALSGGLFGAALQQPAVLLFIAATLVVLALGSFGVYQFQPPAGLMRWAGGASSGIAGALFMGLTMGVVAAPCVGPIVVGLLVYVGAQQDALLGFALFFALAVGMGAPYVVLATVAGAIRHLPRSGDWLVWTERLFGSVLLCLAVYFVQPLLPAPLARWALPAAIATAAVYLGFVEPSGRAWPRFRWSKRLAAVLALLVVAWLWRPTDARAGITWGALATPHAVAAFERPVVLDFVADWCLPCREMEETTYVDPGVLAAARHFAMLKADLTEENETTEALREHFDVVGVPTVIVFDETGRERHRFVGYTGPDELLAAMQAVR